jgi:hypothetical protein
MSKASKIIVTIVIIVLFIVLFAVIVGVRGDAGYSTPGPLGLIVGFGMIGAIKAVWKKEKNRRRQQG